VQRERAFKFRFYPSGEQERLLRRQFGCNRKVWNWGLAVRQQARERDKTHVTGYDLMKLLPALKDEFPFLREVSDVPLQQALRDQDRAFSNFFKSVKGERAGRRVGFPRPKNVNSRKSARYTRSGFRYRDGRLFLAKMKHPLDIEWSRPLPEGVAPSSVTVSLDSSGRWFISILCVDTVASLPIEAQPRAVGIDLGLRTFAVLSDETVIEHPKVLAQRERQLKRYQRSLSRKVGSKKHEPKSRNFEKQRKKVARQHARVTDARRDFLHKATTSIVHKYDIIVVEDLAVANMVKNRRLAKSISDSGWAEFRSLLAYKTDWYGKRLVVINRFAPTSKTCSDCGAINSTLRLADRSWVCAQCGTLHDRDLNAAQNILAAGYAVTACGEDVRPTRPRGVARKGRQTSVKQEPTEARLAS
jgi:putative transposase